MKNKVKLAIGIFLFGIMTFFYGVYWGTIVDLESGEISAETFIERTERVYPEANWEACPEDMEIHAYNFEDKNIYVSGSVTLIKGTQTININSGKSMQPFLMPGNKVIVELYEDQELKVGMVVISEPVYKNTLDMSASGFVHRIVNIEGDTVYTLGDNNERCEVWTENQIKWIARGFAL